jgi:hypothetical protein
VRLEGEVTLRVEEQVLGESLHVITQSTYQRGTTSRTR